jgi:hypothetical protein
MKTAPNGAALSGALASTRARPGEALSLTVDPFSQLIDQVSAGRTEWRHPPLPG